MEGEPELPQAIARTTNTWWCTCSKCTVMPEEIECQCCQENHYLTITLEAIAGSEDEDEVCITSHADFGGLIGSWTVNDVLDTQLELEETAKRGWAKRSAFFRDLPN
ncbi:hypothetical protein SKAU_G00098070 [Synaphobranchus kaupii]|uniref:Uncharacterized protein n=1 Tax=Synaphobranchus kaupii TaxID=118154 RepID=A0A9Q1FYK9_SYNKA|nr:hypothetical protein SKAU_G00098070 [Synaphobranchus kaupii]